MNCPKCQKQISENVNFCPYCRTNFNASKQRSTIKAIKNKSHNFPRIIPFLPTIIAQLIYYAINTGFANGMVYYYEEIVSAVNISSFFILIITIIAAGVGILINQKLAKNNAAIFLFNILFAIIITILIILFTSNILNLMSSNPHIVELAFIYMRFAAVGVVFVFVYNALSTINYNKGSKKSSFYFIIPAVIINIIFNFIFVFSLFLGIYGIGISTVIAQGVSFAAYALYTLKKRKS